MSTHPNDIATVDRLFAAAQVRCADSKLHDRSGYTQFWHEGDMHAHMRVGTRDGTTGEVMIMAALSSDADAGFHEHFAGSHPEDLKEAMDSFLDAMTIAFPAQPRS